MAENLVGGYQTFPLHVTRPLQVGSGDETTVPCAFNSCLFRYSSLTVIDHFAFQLYRLCHVQEQLARQTVTQVQHMDSRVIITI